MDPETLKKLYPQYANPPPQPRILMEEPFKLDQRMVRDLHKKFKNKLMLDELESVLRQGKNFKINKIEQNVGKNRITNYISGSF